ncbi:hypothetical protein CHUAL_000644 [Chamberlinius hualienensis]
MEEMVHKSPVFIERLSKPHFKSDELPDVTASFTFELLSVEKMECVLHVVKRKRKKEKEQQMWLNFVSQSAQQTTRTIQYLETNTGNGQLPILEMSTTTLEKSKSQRIFSLNRSKIRKSGRLSGNTVKKKDASVNRVQLQSECNERLPVNKASDVQRKLLQRMHTRTNKDIPSSALVRHKNVKSENSMKKDMLDVVKSPVGSVFNHHNHVEKTVKNNGQEPKIFKQWCTELWGKLNQIEQQEYGVLKQLRSTYEIQTNTDFKIPKSEKSLPRLPIDFKAKKSENSAVVSKTDIMPLYKSNNSCQIIARFSDAIIDELLNQLTVELHELPNQFIRELFDMEFKVIPSTLQA